MLDMETRTAILVTRDMKMRYLRPAKIKQQLKVIATLTETNGKLMKTSGQLIDEHNEVLTTATATIQRVDPRIVKPN